MDGGNVNHTLPIIIYILQHISNECDPCKLHDVTVESLLYADYFKVMIKGSDGLRNSILKLDQYCNIWDMEVNVSKTEMIVLKRIEM